jgi:biotin synthase
MKKEIENKIKNNLPLSKKNILFLINCLLTEEKKFVYNLADNLRKKVMGDTVYVRGIIEFSNYCKKSCNYCGIRNNNSNVFRYRIPDNEILEICHNLKNIGIMTVVLQSGEDIFFDKLKLGELLKKIKKETNLAITLSVGEQPESVYRYWKKCGMDRFLLRFETSNKKVFKKIHPNDDFDFRINCIKTLVNLGVQTGSGFMIGLPETNLQDIANDIIMCRKLNLAMVGIGPFIPHPDTPLGKEKIMYNADFYSGIFSILRLVLPEAHIPSTTALDVLGPDIRMQVLQRGANVYMPNATPQKYKKNYFLYPNKAKVDEIFEKITQISLKKIKKLGRTISKGYGHALEKNKL